MIALFLIPWAICYVAIFRPEDNGVWYEIIMSGVVGGILFPTVLLVVASFTFLTILFAATYAYGLFLRLNNYFHIVKKQDPFDLELFIFDELHAEEVEKSLVENNTRKLYQLGEPSFVASLLHEGHQIVWTTYGGVSQLRVISTDHQLPTFIIDSLVNNSTSQMLASEKLRMEALDLGSDFGDLFVVYAARKAQVPVYEVLTPPRMIDIISILGTMDLVVNPDNFDFVMRSPTSKVEFYERLESALETIESLNKSSNRSHLPLRTAIAIKRSAPSIESLVSDLASTIIIAGVITILSGLLSSLLGSIDDNFALTHTSIYAFLSFVTLLPIFLSIITVALLVPIFTNTLVFVLTSKLMISIGMSFNQLNRRRKFAYIARKYGY